MKTRVQFFLLFLGLLNTTLIKGQTLVYHNSFNGTTPGWNNYDDANTNARIDGGRYFLTQKQKSNSLMVIPLTLDEGRDFAIETTISHISGISNFLSGLVFGLKDNANYNYFGISANGFYVFGELKGGVDRVVLSWRASAALKSGNEMPNKLRIEKGGLQLNLFINEQKVAGVPMPQFYGNFIGFIVANTQTSAFHNLTVSYIDREQRLTKAVPALSGSILKTAYHTDFDADDQNQWVLPPADSVTTAITNSNFVFNRKAKLGYTATVTAPTQAVDVRRDYLIETEATHYSGTQNNGYGISFGADTAHEYRFWIAASGYYSVGYSDRKGSKTLITWTSTDLINKGDMAKNKLAILHKDGQIAFYINDQLANSYPDINFIGHQFGISASADQSVGFNYLTLGYLDKAPAPVTVANNTPPEIFITSPEVTRGLKVVQSSNVVHVAGTAKDADGIFSVVVNDVQAKVDASGNFTADVPLATGENPLMVVATDNNMNKGTYKFSIVRNNLSASAQSTVEQSAAQGRFYALLIGVQDYTDQSIPSLEGPVGDATNLLQVLTGNYTFTQQTINLLKNPTRAQFFKALDDISANIKPEDNLLIFYAGHGYYDEGHMQGYWFPADAVRARRDTWISNADLIDYITAIKSKHTLLISDACFSGSIFKTRAIEMAPKDIQELYKLPSRKAMTSGAMKEVPDKSVFIQYLVKRLSQNTDKFLPAEQLFASFKAAVINNSANGQVPQFGEIREAGDEGGDFIFIKKD